MAFQAETMFNAVGPNTSFLIIENPTVSGSHPRALMAEDEVIVVFNDESRSKFWVVSADDRSATIRFEDGTQWEMTPPTPADFDTFIKADWANRQKWIVRARVA